MMNRHRLRNIKKSPFCSTRSRLIVVLSIPLACVPMIVPSVLSATIEALAARAEQFESEAKWEQAVGAYREILRIDPGSVAALNRLGPISITQEKYQEGIKYYRQALQLNPNEFGTNLNLGIAYVKMQQYHAAVRPLRKAVTSQPSSLQAQQLLAVALLVKKTTWGQFLILIVWSA